MTTFSYTTGNPSNLTAGATASMNDIQGPFTDLRTFINGANIDTTNLATAAKPVTLLGQYRTVAQGWCVISPGAAAGTYLANHGGNPASVSGSVLTPSICPILVPVTAADWAVSGLTTQLRVRSTMAVNTVAPGAITFTMGLFSISAVAGGSGNISVTTGGSVAGSTVARNSPTQGGYSDASADFTLPADGQYLLGTATSNTTNANSAVVVFLELQVRHV